VDLGLNSAAASDVSFQINSGDCASTEEVVCFDSASETVFLDEDTTYHIIAQTPDDVAGEGLEVSLSTDPIACFPVGSATCSGDDVVFCERGFDTRTETCALGCDMNSCTGDTCANAIPRDGSTSLTLEGSWSTYRNQVDFDGRADCFESGVSLPTDGPEIWVELDGLQSGQLVTIDTSDSGAQAADNAVFIIDQCSDTPSCVAGSDVETFEWTVPNAGDYVLVIDTVNVSDDAFSYQVDIEDPQ
jgi:hypothetical protein